MVAVPVPPPTAAEEENKHELEEGEILEEKKEVLIPITLSRVYSTHPLPYKNFVIARQGKTPAATAEAWRQDVQRFGAESMLKNTEGKVGRTFKDKKLGKKLVRDVFIEE